MPKSKKAGRSKVKGKKKTEVNLSAPELVIRGNELLADFQPEAAIPLFSRAVEIAPDDPIILDAAAEALLQVGDHENALQLFLRSSAISPEDSPYRWLSLAQLQQGETALLSYQTGIRLFSARLDTITSGGGLGIKSTGTPLQADTEKEIALIRKQVSQAYSAIAELYMTDLCFEEGAEQNCEASISSALQIFPESLDANQALASLRLSQMRGPEACQIMRVVYDRLMEVRRRESSRPIIQDMIAVEQPTEDVPELEFCVSSAKILVECSKTDPSFSMAAMELLVDLMNDDDENIELWYISGVAALSLSPPDFDNARYHLERARDMMMELIEQIGEENFPYHEQLELIAEHLRMIEQAEGPSEEGAGNFSGGAAAVQGSSGAQCTEEDDEEDQEWSTDEDN